MEIFQPELVLKDRIGSTLVSTARTAPDLYETIIVPQYQRKENWQNPETRYAGTEARARREHSAALKRVRAGYKGARPENRTEERLWPKQ